MTKARVDITPAMKCLLLTGTPATVRVPGWVVLAQALDIRAAVREAWGGQAAALHAEAAAFGFRPWAERQQAKPTGEGVDRWREAFLLEHSY